ncbi:MAG: RagB/SusD family nutrient uptake outer membrane protein [Bacteroidales bacterium]
MKKITKYITILTMALVLVSCGEDFLNLTPGDRSVADDFYRNEEEIMTGTASLYGLPWFSFDERFSWLVGDCMAGNLYYTYTQEGQFYYVTFTAGNSFIYAGWIGLFRVVAYANVIIHDMPHIASEHGVDENIINEAIAEGRFIRAVAYYHLAELWGEVPIVDNSSELVSANETSLPKNTRESIYEFIRRDLVYAAENLPETESEEGRVTSWSAKGMLAKLHITMAQNGDDESFALARDYARDVIENSPYSLLENYADLFLADNDNNSESLFALQWIAGGYALGNTRNVNWARSSVIADQQWGGGKGCTYDFVQCVEDDDLRRPSIYMTLGDYYSELNTDEGGYTYQFETPDPSNPENNIESPNEVLNHLKKFVVGRENVGNNQDGGNNMYMLRLADLYLIYAEAVLGNASSTNDATALGYFNTIRERAGLDPLEQITFADILHERRVEFALESMHWYDIKRYYYRNPAAAMAYLNGQQRHVTYYRIDGDNDPNSLDSYTFNTDTEPVVVNESYMFLPIPESELSNPLLDPDVEAEEYEFDD